MQPGGRLVSANYHVVRYVMYLFCGLLSWWYRLNDTFGELLHDCTIVLFQNLWLVFQALEQPLQSLNTEKVVVG